MKSNVSPLNIDASRLAYLDASIFEIITKRTLSEFELIKILQLKPYEIFSENALSHTLSLFHTHFIVFNSLYRLKLEGEKQGNFTVHISALAIKLVLFKTDKEVSGSNNNEINMPAIGDDKLQAFYLDWDNFDAKQSEVDALFDSFWVRYNSHYQNTLTAALSVFQFNSIPSKRELKAAFKKRSLILHPDRGGSSEQFKALLSAYQVINKAI
ncbi:DNA-J related domain-containing protein [Psychrosphaera aestuarii]|uniref:DNA-J related domain-containing protein n=1 Tax=Psychrosphaera aestuarii TaxID=1266052 RepID=UPI001B33009B|nr:DNA-J related domain-containing protein [Psychrosphaera aestuarii]